MMMEERTSLLKDYRVRAAGAFFAFVFVYFLLGWLSPLWALLFKEEMALEPLQNPSTQAADALLCVLGLGVWLAFFAQFVLPVKTVGDRLKVVSRLVTYILPPPFGGHGPALFVENGHVRAKEGETKRSGPGVIWLDSASAAVLRTRVEFKRTIGPGVYFTDADEFIYATVDLHQLLQNLGPLDTDVNEKDPFKSEKAKAANDQAHIPEDYEAIQKRRWETSAMTRDGIEVVASLSVMFRISAKEGEGNTRFGFNQANAEKAIRDSITRGADLSRPVWNPLPAKMAVDVWREHLSRYRFSELFESSEDRPETGLELISAVVAKRLRQKEVEQFDPFGRMVVKSAEECEAVFRSHQNEGRYISLQSELDRFKSSDEFSWQGMYSFLMSHKRAADASEYLVKVASLEFDQLSRMGLQVISVSVKRVMFAPDIEERLISQWTTQWKTNAEKERDQVERKRKQAETEGQEFALKDYALDSTREFKPDPLPDKFSALSMLVQGTFKGLRRNSALLKRTSTEQNELSMIKGWLKERGVLR